MPAALPEPSGSWVENLRVATKVESMLEETMNVLEELKQSHNGAISARRFAEQPSEAFKSPQDLVNPIIVRLSEGKHAHQLQSEAPMSP